MTITLTDAVLTGTPALADVPAEPVSGTLAAALRRRGVDVRGSIVRAKSESSVVMEMQTVTAW